MKEKRKKERKKDTERSEKREYLSWLRNFLPFIEYKDSYPFSEISAFGLNYKPAESILNLYIISIRNPLS